MARLNLRLSRESSESSADAPFLPVTEKRRGLLPVRRDPRRVRHPHAVPAAAPVRVDSGDPDAAVELVAGPPLLQVHGAGDRGPVVRDVRLQGAVHEQVVLLQYRYNQSINKLIDQSNNQVGLDWSLLQLINVKILRIAKKNL